MTTRSEGHKWTVAQEDAFIEFLKHHPSIWDSSHRDYSNRDKRTMLINEVVALLDHKFTPAEISYKYQNWRSQMRREIARLTRFAPIDAIMSGGSGEAPPSKWRMYAKLAFLRDSIVAGSTKLSEGGSPLANSQPRGGPAAVAGVLPGSKMVKIEDALMLTLSPSVSPSGQEFAIETDDGRSECSTDGFSNDSARPLAIDEARERPTREYITVTDVSPRGGEQRENSINQNQSSGCEPDLSLQPNAYNAVTLAPSPPSVNSFAYQAFGSRKRKHVELKPTTSHRRSSTDTHDKCTVFAQFVADSLRRIHSESLQDEAMLEIHRLLVKAKRAERSAHSSGRNHRERESLRVPDRHHQPQNSSGGQYTVQQLNRSPECTTPSDHNVTTTLGQGQSAFRGEPITSAANDVSSALGRGGRSPMNVPTVSFSPVISTMANLLVSGAPNLPVQSPLVSPGQHLPIEQAVFADSSPFAQQVRTIMSAFANVSQRQDETGINQR